MPNPYIEKYENNISANCVENAIQSIGKLFKDRMARLKQNKKKWQFDNTEQLGHFPKLKLFYDLESSNIHLLQMVLVNLLNIIERVDTIEMIPDKEDRDDMIEILKKAKRDIPIAQARELFEYIILDISKIDYSNRPSSLIQPDPYDILFMDSNKEPYSPTQKWKTEVDALLSQKQLVLELFSKKDPSIKFEDDISEHVRWAFKHIYKVPYPKQVIPEDQGNIARYHHGIQHVSRAALYIPVLANLYRKHGDDGAEELTQEDLKLLQIATLFHDSAREDEGEDKWDHESGIFLYLYLTRTLNIDTSKAKLIAEAMANKDPNSQGYFIINERTKDEIDWEWQPSPDKKNIYQKLIHDADCLDIIRARDNFDGQHLDFYKQFADTNSLAYDKFASDEIADLICEARSLIEIEGDSRNRTKTEIKEKYEHEDAYQAILKDIDKNKHKIISSLHKELLPAKTTKNMQLIEITQFDPKNGLTEENMRAAIREGKVFARGVATPSAISKKPRTAENWSSYITLGRMEVDKSLRRKKTPTTTSKANRLEKEGNPLRSVSMIGYGSGVFTNAGFLIVNPDIDDVSKVYSVDSGTGRGKKQHLKDEKTTIPKQEKEKQLTELNAKLKLGGATVKFNGLGHVANHVEILHHVKDFSAIYFSSDPNLYNDDAFGSPEAAHRYSPILQAIYLQNEYKNADSKQTRLPIFEYSGLHNTTNLVPESALTKENIINMWVSMCSDYIKKCLADVYNDKIHNMSADDIKVFSMYKVMENKYAKKNAPADTNYEKELREAISQAILEEKKTLIAQQEQAVLNKIKENKLSVFSDEAFFNLIRNPTLASDLHDRIKEELGKAISARNWDISNVDHFLNTGRLSIDAFNFLSINKDEIFKKNQVTKEIFYATKLMRMYTLANQMGLANETEEIQQVMQEIATNAIDSEMHRLDTAGKIYEWSRFDTHRLTQLINFTLSFGIDLKLKDQMNNLFKKYDSLINIELESSFKSSNPCQKIKGYCDYLDDMLKLGVLKPESNIIKDNLNSIREKVPHPDFDDSVLIPFLSVRKRMNAPSSEQKEIILKWFSSQNNFWITGNTVFFVFQLNKLMPLHDLDLFKEVINHIAINFNPAIYGTNKIQISSWLQWLKESKEYLVRDNDFTDAQIVIIKNKSDELFSKLISDLKSEADEKDLIEGIYSMMKSDLDIDIPAKALFEAHHILNKISLSNVMEWDKPMYLYLHEKLPNPDQRPNFENQFIKMKQNI